MNIPVGSTIYLVLLKIGLWWSSFKPVLYWPALYWVQCTILWFDFRWKRAILCFCLGWIGDKNRFAYWQVLRYTLNIGLGGNIIHKKSSFEQWRQKCIACFQIMIWDISNGSIVAPMLNRIVGKPPHFVLWPTAISHPVVTTYPPSCLLTIMYQFLFYIGGWVVGPPLQKVLFIMFTQETKSCNQYIST